METTAAAITAAAAPTTVAEQGKKGHIHVLYSYSLSTLSLSLSLSLSVSVCLSVVAAFFSLARCICFVNGFEVIYLCSDISTCLKSSRVRMCVVPTPDKRNMTRLTHSCMRAHAHVNPPTHAFRRHTYIHTCTHTQTHISR